MTLADDSLVQGTDRRAERRADPADQAEPNGADAAVASEPDETTDLASALAGLASSSFEAAVRSLLQGAQEIDALSRRCDQLRAELADAEGRHRQCLQQIRDEVLHWQDLVNQLVDHCRRRDRELDEAVLQRGLSEERAAGESKRAHIAEQRMAAFERLITGIHDQLLSAIVKDRCDHPVGPQDRRPEPAVQALPGGPEPRP